MRSLVLIGHGSHHHGESARATQQVAEALRGRGLAGHLPYDEVLEGYWQQEPGLRQVLRTAASSDVTVVPVLLSEGYVTETVLPRELGLGHQGPVPPGGVARVLGGRQVRYTRPLGAHPGTADVIAAQASDTLPAGTDPADVTLLLLAARSGNAALETHAQALRGRGLFAGVEVLVLEPRETPSTESRAASDGAPSDGAPSDWPLSEWPLSDWPLSEWPGRVTAGQAVLVPFVTHLGEHAAGRIQHALAQAAGRFPQAPPLHVGGPVGAHPAVADVVLALAAEGREDERGGDIDQAHAEAWAALRQLAERGGRLGEVLLTPHGGLFELRHMLDEGRATLDMQTVVTPEGLRDLTARDEAGRWRPIRTWRTLPRGWRAVLSAADLRLGLELLYPAVVEESYAHEHRRLHSTPWMSTARRQTGALARVQRATPDQVDAVAARVCASCLRTRLWAGNPLGQTIFSGVPGGLPCAEACTVLLSAVRDEVAREAAGSGD